MSWLTLPTSALARLRRAGQPLAMGLYLGEERLHLVQFEAVGSALHLRAAASLAYPSPRGEWLGRPRRWRGWLRSALAEHRFAGRRVVTCLPANEMRLFPVHCALAPGQSADAAITQALRERLQGELASSVVDYLPIRNDDDATDHCDALVAVAPRAAVMAHLQLLEAAGLDPVALEVGPSALARLVALVNVADVREPHPHVLVVNFGRQSSHVSVVWGRRLVLDREIDFAEAALVQRVASVLELGPDMARRLLATKGLGGGAEAPPARADGEMAQTLAEVLRPEMALLLAEINKTLVYTASRSRGRGIDQIYLLGSVAQYEGVDRLLQQQLKVPVQVLDPLRPFPGALGAAARAPLAVLAGMAVAAGLALREAPRHA
ncbi:MAG: pilus assembly protein PilM [Burkholderiales bacterium]|nr:pilus assembly protein PilM [Burkholderiales bacterium]